MEIAAKEKIENIVNEVRRVSFEEKINATEEKVNLFLDAILLVNGRLNAKAEKISTLANRFEAITWLELGNNQQECLMLLNDLIAQAKDLHSSLIRNYVAYAPLRNKGLAKEAIKTYKAAIDDFKEAYTDLESVFFFLPHMPDFKETTKELSLL